MAGRIDLPDREAWRLRMKSLLRKMDTNQGDVAIDLEDLEDGGKTSEVNRFVAGDGPTLWKWFNVRRDFLEVFANSVGKGLAAMDEELQRALIGETSSGWHPAFPHVDPSAALIPTPLRSTFGKTPHEVARKLVRNQLSHAWDKDKVIQPVWISSREHPDRTRIAANQLVRALGDAVRQQREELHQAAVERFRDDQFYQAWNRQPRRVDAPEPPPEISVFLTTDHDDSRKLAYQIVLADKRPGLATEIRLEDWDAGTVVELARRLSSCNDLTQREREALGSYAEMLESNTTLWFAGATPDMCIRVLAEVAASGCPAGVGAARRLLLRALWKPVARHPALTYFDDSLLERYFGALATRLRPSNEPGGPWFQVPLGVAAEVLGAVTRESAGVDGGRGLVDFLDRIAGARSKSEREKAVNAARRALAVDPATRVLDGLTQGGILLIVDDDVRPASKTLACVAAARHLGSLPDPSIDWSRMVDPAWDGLIDELSTTGAVGSVQMLDAVDGRPAELAVDACAWVVRCAALEPRDAMPTSLLPSWATLLWAASHDLWRPKVLYSGVGPLRERHRAPLQRFSRRYWLSLPRAADPLKAVRDLVSEEGRRLIEAFQPTPEPEAGESYGEWHRFLMAFHLLADDRLRPLSASAFAERVRQVEPPPENEQRLVAAARAGIGEARALLSGAAAFDASKSLESRQPAIQVWRSLPWKTRIREATTAELEPRVALAVFGALAAEAPEDDEEALESLVALARHAGPDQLGPFLERALIAPPGAGGRAEWGFLLGVNIAHALGDADVLTRCMESTCSAMSGMSISLDAGAIVVWHQGTDQAVLLGPKRSGTFLDVGAALDVYVERWHRRATMAGHALLDLGHPDALRQYAANPMIEVPDSVYAGVAAIEMLLDLFQRRLTEILQLAPPLSGLSPSPEDRRQRTAANLSSLHIGAPWIVDVGVLGADAPPKVKALANAMWDLADWQAELPDELLAWLLSMRPVGARVRLQDGWGYRRYASVRLLTAGDVPTWKAWVHGDRSPALQHLDTWLCKNEPDLAGDWLDQAFADGTLHEWPEVTGRIWQLLHTLADPDRDQGPHPLVARAIQDLPAHGLILAERAGPRDSVRAAMRERHRWAPDPRTKAWWAFQLQDDALTTSSVRHWLLEDEEPWSGGRFWDPREGVVHGGTSDLLTAALADLPAQDLKNGLKRIWKLHIEQDAKIEVDDQHPSLLGGKDAYGGPLKQIAWRLAELGEAEFLFGWLRDLPGGPSPTGQEDSLRQSTLRVVLWDLWLDHAPLAELEGHLRDGHEVGRTIAFRYLHRGGSGAVVAAWARGPERLDYDLLARVSPGEVEAQLQATLTREADAARVVSFFLEDVGRERADPRLAQAAQRMFLQATAADETTPEAARAGQKGQ